MGSTKELGKRFRQLRRAVGLSRDSVVPLLGCSVKTIGNFERGDFNTEGPTVLRAVELIRQWEKDLHAARLRAGRADYGPTAPGVVRVETMTDPLQIILGGLTNTAALLQDESIPLRARLVHTRTQLEFLLENFLSDASLPAE